MRVLPTFLGGFAIAAIAVGCGGKDESGADTEASATLPTVTAPALPSQQSTTAKKPAAGHSDGGNRGQPSSKPVPASTECPPNLSRTACNQLTDALANPAPSQPSKPSCPSTLTKAECKELAQYLRDPNPSGSSRAECPPDFTPEQCDELARAVGK